MEHLLVVIEEESVIIVFEDAHVDRWILCIVFFEFNCLVGAYCNTPLRNCVLIGKCLPFEGIGVKYLVVEEDTLFWESLGFENIHQGIYSLVGL